MNRTTLLCLFFLPALLNAQEFAQLNEAEMAALFNNPMYNNPEEDRVRPPEEVQRIIDLRTEAALEKLKKQNTQRHLLAGLTLTGLGALTFYKNAPKALTDSLLYSGLNCFFLQKKNPTIVATFKQVALFIGMFYLQPRLEKNYCPSFQNSFPNFKILIDGSLIQKYGINRLLFMAMQADAFYNYGVHGSRQSTVASNCSVSLLCSQLFFPAPNFPLVSFMATKFAYNHFENLTYAAIDRIKPT